MPNEGFKDLSQKDQLIIIQKEIEMLIKKRQDHRLRESQISQPKLGVGKLMLQKYEDFLKISRLIEEKLANARDGSFEAIAENIRNLILKLFEKYRDINPTFFAKKKLYYLDRIKKKMAELLQIKKRKLILHTKTARIRYPNEKDIAELKQMINYAEGFINNFEADRFERFSKRVQSKLDIFTAQERHELIKIFEAMKPDVNEYKEAQRRKTLGEKLFEVIGNAKPMKFEAAKAIKLLKQNLLIDDKELQFRKQTYNPTNRPKSLSLTIEKRNNRYLMVDNYDDVIGSINNLKGGLRGNDKSRDINARKFDKNRVDKLLDKMNQTSRNGIDKSLLDRRGKSSSPNLMINTNTGVDYNKNKRKFFKQYNKKLRTLNNFNEESLDNSENELNRTFSKRTGKNKPSKQGENGKEIDLQNTIRNNSKDRQVKCSNPVGLNKAVTSKINNNKNVFYNNGADDTSDDECQVSKSKSNSPSSMKGNKSSSRNKKNMSYKDSEPTIFHDDLFEVKQTKFRKDTRNKKTSKPVFNDLSDTEHNTSALSQFSKYLYSLNDEQLMQIHMLMDNYKNNPIVDNILNDNSLNTRQKFLSLLKASSTFQRFPSIQWMKPRDSEFSPTDGYCFGLEKKAIVTVKDQVHKGCYSFFCKVRGQEAICPHGYANSKVLDYNGDIIDMRNKECIIKRDKIKNNKSKTKNKGKLVGIPKDSSKTEKRQNNILQDNQIYDIILSDKRMKSDSYRRKVLKINEDVNKEVSNNKIDKELTKESRESSLTQQPVECKHSKHLIDDGTSDMIGTNYFENIDNSKRSSDNQVIRSTTKGQLANTNRISTKNEPNHEIINSQTDKQISKHQTTSNELEILQDLLNKQSSMIEEKKDSQKCIKNPSDKQIKRSDGRLKSVSYKAPTHFSKNAKKECYLNGTANGNLNIDIDFTINENKQSITSNKYSGQSALKTDLSDIRPKVESTTKNMKISDRMFKAYSNRLTENLSIKHDSRVEINKNSKIYDLQEQENYTDTTKQPKIQYLNQKDDKSNRNSGTFKLIEKSMNSAYKEVNAKSNELLVDNIGNNDKINLKTADLDLLDFNMDNMNSVKIKESKNAGKASDDQVNVQKSNNTFMQTRPTDILSTSYPLNKINETKNSRATKDIGNILPETTNCKGTNLTEQIQRNTASNYFDLNSSNDKSKSQSDNTVNKQINEELYPSYLKAESQSINKFFVEKTGASNDDVVDFKVDNKIKRTTVISTPYSGTIEMEEQEVNDTIGKKSDEHKVEDISDYFNNL